MPACATPVSDEALLDYLGAELGGEAEGALETHLFGCVECGARAERLAGLVASIAGAIPPVLSADQLARLEREGRVEAENVMHPGEAARVPYPTPGRVLLHRFRSPALTGVERVDLRITAQDGSPDRVLEAVPFDRQGGEVLVACQSHFADLFPPDLVFSVEGVAPNGRRDLARYTVHHRRG